MARIAIITGATGGIGEGFVRAVSADDEIDEIWAVGRNVKNLSRALGVELKKRGISVTCVCPGWVDTGMLGIRRYI